MTDEYAARAENEGKAISKVLEECRKCGISQCHAPCGIARVILATHGLEYQGGKP